MAFEYARRGRSARIIVVGNEKGGSGKSTLAMNIAIALMKAGQRVATIDLDARQRTFTNYIENRRAWAQHVGRDLEIPEHLCLEEAADERAAQSLTEAVEARADNNDFIVIDSPGHDSALSRQAHAMADTLVTPLNDSFVDFDVLGSINPATLGLTDISHYGRMVEEARRQRQEPQDWIVLRNRLSMVNSRNKRLVAEMLEELSGRLNFRCVEGLAERLIFREYFSRGLTAVDDLDRRTLGARPTMSHATARFEVENLLREMGLGELMTIGGVELENRDAA